MHVNIKNHYLNRTHMIGKKQSCRTKPRPIIVMFVRYKTVGNFIKIKYLNFLTLRVLEVWLHLEWGCLRKHARSLDSKNTSTLDGWIIYMDESLQKPKCYYE